MNPELREAIGKAVYEQEKARLEDPRTGLWEAWDDAIDMSSWDEAVKNKRMKDICDHYRACGEKAVEALLQPIVPTLVELTKSLVGLNQHQQDAIRYIVKAVTGRELEEL